MWNLILCNELFILLHCDPLGYLIIWIYILTMHDFATLCTRHLKIIGSESHTDHPNVDIISQRSYLLMFSPISLEQYLSIGKLSNSTWWIQVFENFNVCLKPEILVLSTKTFNCFPEQKLSKSFPELFSLLSFLRKYLPNTQVWKWPWFACLLFLQITSYFMRKAVPISTLDLRLVVDEYCRFILKSFWKLLYWRQYPS